MKGQIQFAFSIHPQPTQQSDKQNNFPVYFLFGI